MGVIYTISHPLTNEVVYVGASKMLAKRTSAHVSSKSNQPVSIFIRSLRDNYMLPKIEVIDICDSDELMYFEQYWIHQLKAWGFNLLNKNKTLGVSVRPREYVLREPPLKVLRTKKQRYIKITPEEWVIKKAETQRRIAEQKEQKRLSVKENKKWNLASFDIGKVYTIPKNKKNSFVTMFNQYAKSFNLVRHCTLVRDGDMYIYTVCDGKIVFDTYGRTKGGAIRYKPLLPKKEKVIKVPKITRYKFIKSRIGDTFLVPLNKEISFQNTFGQFKILYPETNLDWNKERVDNNNFLFTIVDKADRVRKNMMSEETKNYILTSDKSTNEISKELGLLYGTVYNMRERNKYKTK
jgi:hypothetical protein